MSCVGAVSRCALLIVFIYIEAARLTATADNIFEE